MSRERGLIPYIDSHSDWTVYLLVTYLMECKVEVVESVDKKGNENAGDYFMTAKDLAFERWPLPKLDRWQLGT